MERNAKRFESAARLRLVLVEQVEVGQPGESVLKPKDAHMAALKVLGNRDRECFLVMHLNGKHRLVSAEIVSVGTLTTSLVHPREVFKGAFLANAAAIICAHNHPSGEASPSPEDLQVCKRLKEAGALLGVSLLDFLIVAREGHWSASENGKL